MIIMGYRKNTTNQELLHIEQTAGNVNDNTTNLQEAQTERNQAWRYLRAILKDHQGERLRDLQIKIQESLG